MISDRNLIEIYKVYKTVVKRGINERDNCSEG